MWLTTYARKGEGAGQIVINFRGLRPRFLKDERQPIAYICQWGKLVPYRIVKAGSVPASISGGGGYPGINSQYFYYYEDTG